MTGWYIDWIGSYLAANDANTIPNQALLKTWFRGFDAIRATPDEMRQATFDVLALENRPMRFADHFAAIRGSIMRRRADSERRTTPDYDRFDRGRCVNCGDTGWVTVPHARYSNGEGWRAIYSNGRQRFPTMAVICPCECGRRAVAAQLEKDERQRAMTLETYEQMVNGHWREQMAEQRDRDRVVIETENGIDPNAMLKNLSQVIAMRGGAK